MDYRLLTEKEAMWAEMLMEVLKNNGIPCISHSLFGAGFALKTGMQDHLQVYVPMEYIPKAKELLEELFSEQSE